MARPSLLTPKVQRTICAALRDGHSFEVACEFAGIAPSTAYEWCARGEGRDARRPATSPYREFAEAVARAEGAAWRDDVHADFAEPSERSKNGQASSELPSTLQHFSAEAAFAFTQSSGEAARSEGFAESEHEGAQRSTFGDADELARPANPSESQRETRFAEPPGTSRHVQAREPFAEPQNWGETGTGAGLTHNDAAFAEQAKSDTQKRVSGVSGVGRARAREQDPMRTTRATAAGRVERHAPLPWESQRSRRKGTITRDIGETIF
jgi:hypothetical protein